LEKHLHHCGFSFAKYVLKAHFQVNFIHHVEERHTWVHKLGSKNQWWQIVGQTAWILKSSSRLFALTNFANFSVRPNISGHNFGIGDQQNFRFKLSDFYGSLLLCVYSFSIFSVIMLLLFIILVLFLLMDILFLLHTCVYVFSILFLLLFLFLFYYFDIYANSFSKN